MAVTPCTPMSPTVAPARRRTSTSSSSAAAGPRSTPRARRSSRPSTRLRHEPNRDLGAGRHRAARGGALPPDHQRRVVTLANAGPLELAEPAVRPGQKLPSLGERLALELGDLADRLGSTAARAAAARASATTTAAGATAAGAAAAHG